MTDLPKVLYHYTTAQGLLGILKSNTLHASDLLYMNDFTELKYTGFILNQELLNVLDAYPDLKEFVGSPKLENLMGDYTVYGACFCKNGDQLSQWRTYSEKGTGYAIGFDSKQLKKAEGFILGDVIYSIDEHKKIIRPSIDEYLKDLNDFYFKDDPKFSGTNIVEQLKTIVGKLLAKNYVPFLYFKDTCFAVEEEWRILNMRLPGYGGEKSKFKEIRGTIVPYIEMKFPSIDPEKKELLPIERIIQGPLSNPELGKKSLQMLLNNKGYDNVEVIPSKVPIRF